LAPYLIPILVLSLASSAAVAHAQAVEQRVEIGGQASVLRLSDVDTTNAGFGARLLFKVTDWLSIDGEVSFFPHDKVVGPTMNTPVGPMRIDSARRRTDGLVGIKVGTGRHRFGVFAKVRPGVTRLYDKRTECVGNGCAVVLIRFAPNSYRTEFAVDLGGGVELYPSRRTVARAEIGDTVIRHRSLAAPGLSGCTSHNLSSRAGLGVRF
jgi:hypothetical protein